MRIIGGKLGSRQFDSPKSNKTHPMSDKMRGALFTILGDIQDLSVLDTFAGSGALGFEAMSRGAASVVAIEQERSAQQMIERNITALALNDSLRLIKMSVSSWSQANPKALFDVVLSDPPYDNLQIETVEALPAHVVKGGVFVLSWPQNTALPQSAQLEKISQKTYGDAQLIFYRRL